MSSYTTYADVTNQAWQSLDCPVMRALLRSRALRKADKRFERVCGGHVPDGENLLHESRQRIKRVLTERLARDSQKSETSLNNSLQKSETQKPETHTQITTAMILTTCPISSQFVETETIARNDFLRL